MLVNCGESDGTWTEKRVRLIFHEKDTIAPFHLQKRTQIANNERLRNLNCGHYYK
jgi:hypothetical protein